MKKRILSIVLCVAMLLSVVPFTLTAGAVEPSPYATNKGDGAYYFLNVYDDVQDPDYMGRYNSSTKTSPRQKHEIGSPTDYLAKTTDGTGYSTSGVLFLKKFGDESFIEFDYNEGKSFSDSINQGLHQNVITYNGDVVSTVNTGLHTSIPRDNLAWAAMRVKIDAKDGDNSASAFTIDLETYNWAQKFPQDLSGAYCIDVNGQTTKPSWTTYFNFDGEFDGWVVFPFTAWDSGSVNGKNLWTSDAAGMRVWLYGSGRAANSSWTDKIFYLGDIVVFEDNSLFNAVHGTPLFDATATNTSITVTSTEADAVYSLDKNAAADKWLELDEFNATLANLEKEVKYTIYAKYPTGTKVSSKEVWTSPYGTHKGDGASYALNVYDNVDGYYLKYVYGRTDNAIGWPGSHTLAKKPADDGTYDADGGNGGGYFIRQIDGETFIEFDKSEYKSDLTTVLDSCVNASINANVITYNGESYNDQANDNVATKGLHSSIDTTNLTHVAIRVKIDELDNANKRSNFFLYVNGKWPNDLTGAYTIDKATGAINNNLGWKEVNFTFTGEFDGWVVVPMSAWDKNLGDSDTSNDVVGKSLWTTEFTNLQPYMHKNACHWNGDSNWDNKILYLGDVVVFEDEDLFKSVHVCGAAGHVEGTAATCKDKATCSVCKQPYGNVDPDAHGTNTELRGKVTPDCKNNGYTGDTWCKDCNTEIAKGQLDPATGAHVDADDKWETDGTNHWHTCSCGTEFDKNAHTGGTATCKDKKVCDTCKAAYGEVDADAHGTNTELKGVVKAECGKPGYTGDTWCKDCNTEIAKGKATDALTHTGGEATCKDKAICDLCKAAYGEVKADNHKGETELKDAKPASKTEKGYTGDTVCKDCGVVLEKGEEIPVIVEDDKQEEKPEQTPGSGDAGDNDNAGAGSEGDGTLAPDTGDSASILLAVLMVLMAGAVVVLAKKRA